MRRLKREVALSGSEPLDMQARRLCVVRRSMSGTAVQAHAVEQSEVRPGHHVCFPKEA
jgi:hypothetical protein